VSVAVCWCRVIMYVCVCWLKVGECLSALLCVDVWWGVSECV